MNEPKQAQTVPSREELAAIVARQQEQIDLLMKNQAKQELTPGERMVMAKRLQDAEAELASFHAGAARPFEAPRGPRPRYVAYKGKARAKVDCVYGVFRWGPNPAEGRKQGDVFDVELPVLWSDDPFEPVTVVGVREDGSPVCEINKRVPIIDARWRVKTDPESRDPVARAV